MLTKNIVLSEENYQLLEQYVKTQSSVNNYSVKKLSMELRNAKIVADNLMPPTVVQLNSKVKLKVKENNQTFNISVVMPQYADIKQHKISIFSPMGSAIIGYEKGDEISWEVPAGLKTIKIVSVEK